MQISDKLKPPGFVVAVMKWLAKVGPTWPILPTDNVLDKAFRDLDKRNKVRCQPLCGHAVPTATPWHCQRSGVR